jgi:protein tyrosine/serine phosphatase
MTRYIRALCLALVFACCWTSAAAERPKEWAQPMNVQGVPNLHQITPNIYRSAQPTPAGMQALEEMGIRTVISFRAYHNDHKALTATKIHEVHIPIETWEIRDAHVVATLRRLKQEKDGPFLIHCQHGADRTGLMSAMYRIVIQGWDKQQAIEEMTKGDYGYHVVWKNILQYIKNVDVEKIRRQVEA